MERQTSQVQKDNSGNNRTLKEHQIRRSDKRLWQNVDRGDQTGTKTIAKLKQIRDEFSIISTLISLRNDITIDTIGKLSYVKFEHQKVTVLALQKKNVTYYVTVNRKEKDLEKIISEIKKTI